MKTSSRAGALKPVVLLALLTAFAGGLALAAQPAAPQVSSFAPIDDVVAQVNYFIERLDEALASEEAYKDAQKSRVKKDANTIAVLGLALALHDADHKMKPAGPAMIKASGALAKATDQYAAAKKALDELKTAVDSGTAQEGAPKDWQRVASLGQLMKQVPLLNNSLKRGLEPRRFKKQAKENAGLSASLAVIAQATLIDTHEVKNPADMDRWYQFSAEMRDAAGQVNAAVHKGDQAAAAEGLKRLSVSCDTCHAVFRPDEE